MKVPANLLKKNSTIHSFKDICRQAAWKRIFLWPFWKNFNSYCYQSLLSCKCRIQHITRLHLKQMKLKISISTHIEPIFPIGFLLLRVHSQHNTLEWCYPDPDSNINKWGNKPWFELFFSNESIKNCLHSKWDLKVVFATFLLVYFLCLKKSTCETRSNVFYFTSKALFVLEIIKF